MARRSGHWAHAVRRSCADRRPGAAPPQRGMRSMGLGTGCTRTRCLLLKFTNIVLALQQPTVNQPIQPVP